MLLELCLNVTTLYKVDVKLQSSFQTLEEIWCKNYTMKRRSIAHRQIQVISNRLSGCTLTVRLYCRLIEYRDPRILIFS